MSGWRKLGIPALLLGLLVLVLTIVYIRHEPTELRAITDEKIEELASDTSASVSRTTAPSASPSPSQQPQCHIYNRCDQCVATRGCGWCAGTYHVDKNAGKAACTLLSESAWCHDLEPQACSSVLVRKMPMHILIMQFSWDTGGPEAMLQAFYSTKAAGFTVSPYGGEKPPEYWRVGYTADTGLEYGGPDEFYDNPWDFHRYGPPEYVVVSHENEVCRREAANTRVIKMGLSTYFTSLRSAPACSCVGHSHFTTDFFGQSPLAVWTPYMSPWLHHNVSVQKEPIVVVDGDSKYDAGALEAALRADPQLPLETKNKLKVVLGKGMKRDDFFALLSKAMVVVDGHMVGAERITMESALLGGIVVVDDDLNGGNKEDLNIPDRFRFKRDDFTSLVSTVKLALETYEASLPEMEPYKELVNSLKPAHFRQLRRYFSGSAHFIAAACTEEDELFALPWVMSVHLYVPFASVELIVSDKAAFEKKYEQILRQMNDYQFMAITKITAFSELNLGGTCSTRAAYRTAGRSQWAKPTKSAYTVYMDVRTWVASDDFLFVYATQLSFEPRVAYANRLMGTGVLDSTHAVVTELYPPCLAYIAANADNTSTDGEWLATSMQANDCMLGTPAADIGKLKFYEAAPTADEISLPLASYPFAPHKLISMASLPPVAVKAFAFFCRNHYVWNMVIHPHVKANIIGDVPACPPPMREYRQCAQPQCTSQA